MNSLAYEIVWVRNASLFFKAFQTGRPNWEKPRAKIAADFPGTAEWQVQIADLQPSQIAI